MTDISIKQEIQKLRPGERWAMRISRLMGSWWFIGLLGGVMGICLIRWHLWNGNALDVFNLAVSEYTLFVDVIILKANNALNDSFLMIMNKIISLEETIMTLCNNIIETQEEQTRLLKENNIMLKQLLANKEGMIR